MPSEKDTPALLPLGAMLLSASFGSWAQTTPAPQPVQTTTLRPVTVIDKAEGRDSVRATTTTLGKGNQALRDIPQSITVVTEKLMDDRNLDTMKEALKNTAGITFQAAEGGEEDIRLRGFSLAGTGDIFLDGMRDPAFYDRDTFNNDRIEVLRGSASMLFGRGSTGGAVNQVSKLPRLVDSNEVTTTVGNHAYKRITGDFNKVTGENQALRVNIMATKADDNGSGSSIDKHGIAAAYRWGIGTADEFLANAYDLDNRNGINYGLPWIRPTAAATSAANTLIPGLSPTTNYGLASDRNDGAARLLAFSHLHRVDNGSELKTQVRKGAFERDLRAGAVRFVDANASLENLGAATQLRRGNNFKIQDVDTLHAQSDLTAKFAAGELKHEVQAGVDIAREEKVVYVPRTAAQGGVDLTKPLTTIGTPGTLGSVDESQRVLRTNNRFINKAWGTYVQDLVEVVPHWKVLGGLRYDSMDGRYDQFNIPTAAPGPESTISYQQKISAVSKRVGLLWQPDEHRSFHFSWGTSFNTSGDAYSYNAQSANTPPEASENIELGAKLDSQDKRFSYRFAAFRSTKKNERNTDPDTAATRLLLSGQRHTAGFEFDISGRITPKWEVYGSYMWMPVARVDVAASTSTTAGNRVGDRPGLSPRHSGTFWTTYQFTSKWRAGAGVNFRSRQAPADVTAPAWEAPGFATMDVMAEYNIDDTFSLKGNVSNVADKLYADALYRGHYVPGAGRLVQLSLTARF